MATPFPFLNTKRLYLRKILPSDAVRVHYFRSDKEINKFIKRPEPQTFEMTVAHIERITADIRTSKSITWGIMLQDSPTLIGSICLWNFSEDRHTAEVGYDLDPKFHGKGFMSEALKEAIEFGLNREGFKTIKAYTDYRNTPSKKLLKQHGFIPSYVRLDSDNQNNEIYHLNR